VALRPEEIWEQAVYRFPEGLRRVVSCDRVWVVWEWLRPSCAPPGHPGRLPGYTFPAELKRFAAGALAEVPMRGRA